MLRFTREFNLENLDIDSRRRFLTELKNKIKTNLSELICTSSIMIKKGIKDSEIDEFVNWLKDNAKSLTSNDQDYYLHIIQKIMNDIFDDEVRNEFIGFLPFCWKNPAK